MDESRNARQPKKPDNNELWSWIVIALLFAFAWPVGLIVLFAKLSDSSKRKKNRAGGCRDSYRCSHRCGEKERLRGSEQEAQEQHHPYPKDL